MLRKTSLEDQLRIGAGLKHARLSRGMNLAELAGKIGVTEGYLSKLENNRSQASLATLHRLVEVLGMNMSELFASAEDEEKPVVVVRKDKRPKIATGHRRTGNLVTLELLVPGSPGQLLQISIHVIAIDGGSLEPISHDGQEFGFVLEGIFELKVEETLFELHAGDSFYFNSSLPHSYRNVGDKEARVLWVNTPPTF